MIPKADISVYFRCPWYLPFLGDSKSDFRGRYMTILMPTDNIVEERLASVFCFFLPPFFFLLLYPFVK